MYSTHEKRKSVVAERFMRILRDRIYKNMTLVSKNKYIDEVDDIVNKENNEYHSTIRINPVYIKSSTYIDFNVENNDKDTKFKAGYHVKISKDKNSFVKDYLPNWSEKVRVTEKIKNTVRWTNVVEDRRNC